MILALFHGVRRVAADCDGAARPNSDRPPCLRARRRMHEPFGEVNLIGLSNFIEIGIVPLK